MAIRMDSKKIHKKEITSDRRQQANPGKGLPSSLSKNCAGGALKIPTAKNQKYVPIS